MKPAVDLEPLVKTAAGDAPAITLAVPGSASGARPAANASAARAAAKP